MFRTAQIIVVGSEFFSRDKRDTNSIWLTEELEKLGVRVLSKSVVADELQTLTQVIKQGLDSADLVISTGGLGPTEDDRTREAISLALGLELVYQAEIADELERRFAKRGRLMAENNRRQAFIPQGSWVLENETGTAPGFLTGGGQANFLALPGPPAEMKGMFQKFVERFGERFASGQTVLARRTLRVTGLGESDMDGRISELYKDLSNPEVTINFTPQDLEIHITAKAPSLEAGQAMMLPLVENMERRLEGYIFSVHDEGLAEVVVRQLGERGLRLAAAESLTGGHFAHQLCSVPGASAVFEGSIVSYTDTCKQRLLGVSPETLKRYSAVSEQVALEMVEGLRERTGAPLCLACTGYAGPGGGTEKDPVGTVYVAFASPERTSIKVLRLPGSRNLVRARTSQAMLFVLFRYLRHPKTPRPTFRTSPEI